MKAHHLLSGVVLAATVAFGFSPVPDVGECSQKLCVNFAEQFPCDDMNDLCVVGGAQCDNCGLEIGGIWCARTGTTHWVFRCTDYFCYCPIH